MLGLRKRPTYNEVIDYLEREQPKIKYPNRKATFLRNSPYLSQFDGDSWLDLEEQENNIQEEQLRELQIKKLASNSTQTHTLVKASAQSPKPLAQPMDTKSEDFEDVMSDLEDEKEIELRKRSQQPELFKQAIQGAGYVAKNYAYPFTRDILLPATGELALNLTQGAMWLMGKSFWSLADIIMAMNGGDGNTTPQGKTPRSAIGWGSGSGAIGWGSSSSNNNKEEELDELSKKGKGYLIEQIYKKPGWARMFGREDANGYTNDETEIFRKRLGRMKPKELAEILLRL